MVLVLCWYRWKEETHTNPLSCFFFFFFFFFIYLLHFITGTHRQLGTNVKHAQMTKTCTTKTCWLNKTLESVHDKLFTRPTVMGSKVKSSNRQTCLACQLAGNGQQ